MGNPFLPKKEEPTRWKAIFAQMAPGQPPNRRAPAMALLTIGVACGYILFLDIAYFWMGVSLNFVLFTWIVLVESQLKPKLTSRYYQCHAFEQQGKLCRWLWVHWFRRWLVVSGWEGQRKKIHPVGKSVAALEKLERMTRTAEFGHLVVGLVMVGIIAGVGITRGGQAVGWLILLNVLLNGYPILVQRYNRPRLTRILSVLRARPFRETRISRSFTR